MGDPDALARVDGLVKRYGRTEALRGVSLWVEPGEIVGLIGPNGSGKSTLLHILAGLLQPTSGTAWVGGDAPKIGLVLERDGHVPYLSARRNLELLGSLNGRLPDGEIDRVLGELGLDPGDRRRVRSWSQGMRRRLTLAQALLRTPRVLLLDEPTNGLDPVAVRHFRAALVAHRAGGGGVLLASHALSELERLCDRVLLIKDGRIVEEIDSAEHGLDRWVRVRLASADSREAVERLGIPWRPGEHALEVQLGFGGPVPDLVRRLVAAELDVELVVPAALDLEARYLSQVD
jgi:ABC-2 type transport system ATP-binding protein